MSLGEQLYAGLLADYSLLGKEALADGNVPSRETLQHVGGELYVSLLALSPEGKMVTYFIPRPEDGVWDASAIEVFDPQLPKVIRDGDGNWRFDVRPVSQNDVRWRNQRIGVDRRGKILTIGNWGCLLIVYQMWLEFHGVATLEPVALRDAFMQVGRYLNGYFRAGDLKAAFFDGVQDDGWRQRRGREDLTELIAKYMQTHQTPLPIWVDFRPQTALYDNHWVLAVGVEDGELVVADPDKGDVVKLSDRYPIAGGDILEVLWLRPLR